LQALQIFSLAERWDRKTVSNMLQAGTVLPSLSPSASPFFLVKKNDRSWRFCVDYIKLNANTMRNKFPMPVVDEFLDEIAGAKVFTKLDLNSGFHQIRMSLANAPATFQYLMNSIFAAYMRKFVLVFMDGILIYSRSLEEHIHHLTLVFQVLREHQLFIKFKKCVFVQNQNEYLGHIIYDQGVPTDPSKTSMMLMWPTPR
jgi:hypothetical protein